MTRVVLGCTNAEEPLKLNRCSNSGFRKKKRPAYRNEVKQRYNQQPFPSYPRPLRDTQQGQRRTIIAYGDASLQGTLKSRTPIPVKGIQ
ncbi:MAG: hypothetical protein EXX96DRAFT_615788 [Benjaminiella poitrasii]|nr:MAG: hypothetical protein EXX96DRAFT_615788 [Benjaminiella poitrasii]